MNHEEQEDALSKIAADKYDEDLMNIAKECFTNECGWDEYHRSSKTARDGVRKLLKLFKLNAMIEVV